MLTHAGRSRSCVAPHLSAVERTALPASPPVPATPLARQAAYAEAVMAAVLTLQTQLRHPDAKVAHAAAVAIVDLEKTRLRHGEPVAGTHQPSEVLEPLGELAPLGRPQCRPVAAPAGRDEEKQPANPVDSWERFVDQVWDEMQEDADEAGGGDVVSLVQAEERARTLHAQVKERAAGEPEVRSPHPPRNGGSSPPNRYDAHHFSPFSHRQMLASGAMAD